MKQKLLYTLIFIAHCGLCVDNCEAQWSTDPTQNKVLYSGVVNLKICTDGTGGAFVAFQDSGPNLYFSRVDRNGVHTLVQPTQFPLNFDAQLLQDIVYVGNGEALILYTDAVFDPNFFTFEHQVFVNKIDTSGSLLWGNGVNVTTNTNEKFPEAHFVYDREGGCYVGYTQTQNPTGLDFLDAYVQRLDSSGNKLLGNTGLKLNVINSEGSVSSIDINDKLDVYVGMGLYTMRVDSLGLAWGQELPINGHISDNGLFEFFSEFIGQQKLLKVRKYDENGNLSWGGNEVLIDTVYDSQHNGYFGFLKAYSGGNDIWYGKTPPNSNSEGRNQVIRSNGSLQYSFGGISLINTSLQSKSGVPFPTLSLSKLYTFGSDQDSTITGIERYVQKVDKQGNLQWQPIGNVITTRKIQGLYSLTNDLSGGGIMAWYEDPASGSTLRIQQISRNGNLGEVLPLTGDLNNDSSIDSTDSQMILDFITGNIQLNQNQLESADTDGDTKITVNDASNIRRLEAGEIHILPVYFYNSN